MIERKSGKLPKRSRAPAHFLQSEERKQAEEPGSVGSLLQRADEALGEEDQGRIQIMAHSSHASHGSHVVLSCAPCRARMAWPPC